MASSLQTCRAVFARTPRLAARALTARSYSSTTTTTTTTTIDTPESFKPNAAAATTTTAAADNSNSADPPVLVPRWSRTPPDMKADVQLDFAKRPHNKVWSVNNDPRKLDEMYDRLLGPNGRRLLPDELKWLAVTHKSFDQGRRGFNDRLALLGRMALIMEATKQIVAKEPIAGSQTVDEFARQPFEHPQLASLDNLSLEGPKDVAGKDKLYDLAVSVGLIDVVRWKPRLVAKLRSSGVEVVLSSTILAIIGAVTLQHGGVVASQVIQDRILAKMPQ